MVNWNLTWLAPYIASGVILVAMIAGARNHKWLGYTGVAGIAVSALLSVALAYRVWVKGAFHYASPWIQSIGVNAGVIADGLGAFMSIVVSWLSLFIGIYSLKYMENDWGWGRYWFFFTFFVGSMMLLVLADNLILMFIGWEGTGLASYALIGHWYTDEEHAWVGDPGRKALGVPMYFTPSHSGLRAILFTRLGDLGFLIGIATIYVLTGSFSIIALRTTSSMLIAELGRVGALLPFLIMFTLGAFAKSAQIPFHEWLVTAMTGPTPVSALIHAATMVKAGVYFILRFSPLILGGSLVVAGLHAYPLSPYVMHCIKTYFMIIAWVGCLTAFILATMALVSRELKLILAYSTASQIGYMFLAVGVAGAAGLMTSGIVASAEHLMSHAIFKAALFLVAGALLHVAGSRFIDDMGGLAKVMKLSAISMWISGLSLAGVPPLAGFWSKDGIIHLSFKAGYGLIGFIAALTAVLTAAYITRACVRVFHLKPYSSNPRLSEAHEAHPVMLAPYLILSIASLAIGVSWPIIYPKLYSLLAGSTLGLVPRGPPHLELSPLLAVSAAVSIASVYGVYHVYCRARVDFRGLLERSSIARAVNNFLYDRWYINSIYYIVIVGFFKQAVKAVGGVVNNAVDKFYHSILAGAGERFSRAVRRIQRGVPTMYVSLMILGASIVFYYIIILLVR